MTKTRDLADLGGGFIQAGSGAVQRTVESKLQDTVSVKDFGAVGDGVANDTVAIQAAIDSGAKSISFPSGTYIISEALAVQSNQSFFGPGTLKTASVLGAAPTYGYGNTAWGIFQNYQKTNLRFQGLGFDTSGTVALPPGAQSSVRAILLLDCADILITDCRSIGKGGFTGLVSCDRYVISNNFATQTANWADGIIDNWGGWDGDGQHFQITNNNINGSNVAPWGILATDSARGLANFTIANNTVQGALYSGIWVNGRVSVNKRFTISGNIIHSSGEGIRLSDCKDAVVTGNICRQNTYTGITLDAEPGEGTAACDNIIVSDNLLVDNAVAGGVASLLLADTTRRCLITGNTIYSATHASPIRTQDDSYHNIIRNNYYDYSQGHIDSSGLFNYFDGKAGTFTPTLTGVNNYTGGGVDKCWFRVEQGRVHVDAALAVQPTVGANTYTSFGFSLPIPSNFTALHDCVGVVNGVQGASGVVQADIANDRATVAFLAADTSSSWYSVSFSYDIK